MYRLLLTGLLVLAALSTPQAQPTAKTPADFGYRHLRIPHGRETVDVLVMSSPGEEQRRKPLLLFVQGSLPVPLLKWDDKGAYPVFPFQGSAFTGAYHLAIISKPGIPLLAEVSALQPNFSYFDPQTKAPPQAYCERNHLEYYAVRNAAVLKYLTRQPWVDARRVVAAGHSEGSTVVAKMAATCRYLTHVVYLSGNPAGRIATILAQQRNAAPEASADELFRYWQTVLDHPQKVTCSPTDAPKTTYSFSVPPQHYLSRARVPVLVVYGTRDAAAPFNDSFRLEMLRKHNRRIHFKDYPGLEHNFFGFKDGHLDYEQSYWDAVVADFLQWIQREAVPTASAVRSRPTAP